MKKGEGIFVIEADGEFHVVGEGGERVVAIELETLRDELGSYEDTWGTLSDAAKGVVRRLDEELADECERHSADVVRHLRGVESHTPRQKGVTAKRRRCGR